MRKDNVEQQVKSKNISQANYSKIKNKFKEAQTFTEKEIVIS